MTRPATIRNLPVFSSAKTLGPVPLRHPALRPALIQATLDPVVRSIAHVPQVEAVHGRADVDAIVLGRDDGRFVLEVEPALHVRNDRDEAIHRDALRCRGLQTIAVTSEQLREEPRRSNCDLIWSHHDRKVPVDLRLGLLQILEDDGPLSLRELCRRVRGDGEPVAAVMALACLDLLEIDLLSGPIGPATTVRGRA